MNQISLLCKFDKEMFSFFTTVIQKCAIIITWAGFTFASHYYAKIFLSKSSYFEFDVLLLSTVQMLLPSLLLIRKEVFDFNYLLAIIDKLLLDL